LNYYDWYLSSGKENYSIAQDYNMPVFVMGPTKGGTLINEINKKVFTVNNKIELPYLFLNSLDNVKCILTGANTIE
jgi:predicted aldo/keto reductase-like oxidoreductase